MHGLPLGRGNVLQAAPPGDEPYLMQILEVLQRRAPIDFSIVAVNVDSGYEGYEHQKLTDACAMFRFDVVTTCDVALP